MYCFRAIAPNKYERQLQISAHYFTSGFLRAFNMAMCLMNYLEQCCPVDISVMMEMFSALSNTVATGHM